MLSLAIATDNTAASMKIASASFGRQIDATPLGHRVRRSETWSPMLPALSCIPDHGAKESWRNAERKLAPFAPETVGWRLCSGAIFVWLCLTAMMKTSLRKTKRRGKRRRRRMKRNEGP